MPTNPEIRKFVVDHFDHADLDLLIADYFVAYRAKEIPGLGLEKRAQNLIDYCGKTEQLANLEAALQTKHPGLYKAAFGALQVAPVARRARDPQKCFISHASKDAEFAQQLRLDLQVAGASVWIAPDSIEPGEIWMRAIERGLKECGVFVCVLTSNALESEWVKSETEIAIALAKSGEMRIFVLMVEACKASELSIWLTRYQHIGFIDRYAAGLNELKRAIGLIAPAATPANSGPVEPLPRQPATQPLMRSSPANGDTSPAALTVEDMMMCFVPSGEFIMGGTGDRDGGPEHVQIEAKSFWVGKYPITNAQFAQFVHEDGYKRRGFWVTAIEANRWENGQFRGRDGEWREGHREYGEQFSGMNHPVTGVSWYEALAFTEWLRARLGIVTFRLPSEAQWEYAARGPRYSPSAISPLIRAAKSLQAVPPWAVRDLVTLLENHGVGSVNRRIYPWGDDPDPKKMNIDRTGIGATSAVGAFPAGVSQFGCEDISGNVWEWTMTKRTDDYKDYDKKVDNRPDGSEARRVLRGGAFSDGEGRARCAYRGGGSPNGGYNYLGFRVVASPIDL